MPDTVPLLADMVRQALARDCDRPAIEFEGRWTSWGELAYMASSVEQQIEASGVGPNAPVAFVPRNRPSSIATLLGLLAAKRTVRMIYPFQSAAVIAQQIAKLQPAVAILDEVDLAAPIGTILATEGIAGIVLDHDAIGPIEGAARALGIAAQRTGPEAPLLEILTSGTTGPPKQFPIRHQMIAESLIGAQALTAEAQKSAADLPPYLLYFPLGNISGIYSTVPTLVRGQRACLLDRFSIEAWHQYVVRHRPAHSGIPPASMRALLDADIPVADLASIKAMGVGAAPLSPDLQRAFEDRYGIPVLLSYGATEFGGPVCTWSLQLHAKWGRRKLGSVGLPLPGAQIRIVDPESGAVLGPNSGGRVEVISPRIGSGWIQTSDLGRIDEDGFLFLQGRSDSAIMRGGFKILPDVIENALLRHPAITEAAVVDLPDPRLGQAPAAMVVPSPGTSPPTVESMEAHLRNLLPATHVPVAWHIAHCLPRNPSMKIDRPVIRQIFKDLVAQRN
ncbi:class I adenylate-forming enzyme family protein [Blastomonas fulva]|uniref:class I adenylate-forming enzyme family protein n=1 Tax=Blastomonas fulva TaxID=1550728 RepID=UPI003F713C82